MVRQKLKLLQCFFEARTLIKLEITDLCLNEISVLENTHCGILIF